jgi:hypothetical protein
MGENREVFIYQRMDAVHCTMQHFNFGDTVTVNLLLQFVASFLKKLRMLVKKG